MPSLAGAGSRLVDAAGVGAAAVDLLQQDDVGVPAPLISVAMSAMLEPAAGPRAEWMLKLAP